jgi:hypothetical protein
MNEDRLITLILVALLAVGIFGFAIAVFTLSGSDKPRMDLPPSEIVEPHLSDRGEKEPIKPPAIENPAGLTGAVKDETSISPEPSGPPEIPEEKTPAPAPVKDTPESPPVTIISEKDKANGTFFSAQEISQGIIEGKRGTKGDKADFYKILATGKTMTLKLEPLPDDKNQGFKAKVFDKGQKKIGEIGPDNTEPFISLAVEPQKAYYIMLDLTNAPVQPSHYKLHVSFD